MKNNELIRRVRRLWPLALLCLATAMPAASRPDSPPAGVPKGAIIAFMPDPDSKDYSDEQSLRRWLKDQGWAICDGENGTPDLNYRMLLGTDRPSVAGQNQGSRTHTHRVRSETGIAYGRERSLRGGIGPSTRIPAKGHKHRLDTVSERADHLPLSTRVLFILKVQ
ncbi:hypothetical protein [Methylohalobius crimeensis]|uniref:hypothetical protein n=1 Tax=Methylohalobius crimeensis TaxID=244365 RepID=UPI001268DBC0|nr:hypothetical protein [Methylohalobius crimeensis]